MENNTMTNRQNSVLAVPVTLEITSSGEHCMLCSQPLLNGGWRVRKWKPVLVTGTNQMSDSHRRIGTILKVEPKKKKCVQRNSYDRKRNEKQFKVPLQSSFLRKHTFLFKQNTNFLYNLEEI